MSTAATAPEKSGEAPRYDSTIAPVKAAATTTDAPLQPKLPISPSASAASASTVEAAIPASVPSTLTAPSVPAGTGRNVVIERPAAVHLADSHDTVSNIAVASAATRATFTMSGEAKAAATTARKAAASKTNRTK